MDSPILTRLHQILKSTPDQPCLVLANNSFSFREFNNTCLAWSEKLRDEFNAGDRIGLWFERDPAFWFALFASWYCELIPVVLNPTLPRSTNLEIIAGLGLTGVFTAPDLEPPWSGKVHICGNLREKSIDSLPSNLPRKIDTAAILMTSGTTGISKGVILSHKSLGGNSHAMGKRLGLNLDDRWLFTTPPYFTSTISHFLATLQSGATSVAIHDDFLFPAQLLSMINEFKVTGYGCSPLQTRWLIDVIESCDTVPTLKTIMTSGDALPPFVARNFLKKMPSSKLHIVYGLTELGGRFCSLNPSLVKHIPESVGTPINGLHSLVINEKGTVAGPNEEGEVYAYGDYLMDGYLNLPEITNITITENGLKTGDLGYKDSQGNLFLKGRLDDVFKSSGEKVSRVLIEQELLSLNIFQDVAVLPVPDEFLGLIPKVYYVCAPGQYFERSYILKKLTKRLPDTHIPNLFKAVPTIPRTGSGKLIKRELQRFEEDN